MPRLVAAAVLALLWTAVAAAGDSPPRHTIDLDEPGVLEALQRSNPTHYETVRKILDGVLQRSDNEDRKSTRLNSSHQIISYAVFCLKKKKKNKTKRTKTHN